MNEETGSNVTSVVTVVSCVSRSVLLFKGGKKTVITKQIITIVYEEIEILSSYLDLILVSVTME